MHSEKSKIVILSLALTANYGFLDIKGVFYNLIKDALALSDGDMGNIWAVYGIASLLCFIFGGMLADKFSLKHMICFSTFLSVVWHILLAFLPPYPILLVISSLFGVSTILIYFPASTKLITLLFPKETSGKAMGLYYALDGLFLAVVNLGFSLLYISSSNAVLLFRGIMAAFALLGILALVLCLWKLEEPVIPSKKGNAGNHHTAGQFVRTLKIPSVWLIAGLELSAYALYCLITYITPYLTDCWGIPESDALLIGVLRTNGLNIAAGILFGKCVSRQKSGMTVLKRAFGMGLWLPLLSIANIEWFRLPWLEVAITSAAALIVLGLKAISLSTVAEMNYPAEIVGGIIGIVSLIGFSPDAWLYPLAGALIEKNGTDSAVWLLLAALFFLILGGFCGGQLIKYRNHEVECYEK